MSDFSLRLNNDRRFVNVLAVLGFFKAMLGIAYYIAKLTGHL